MIQTPVTRPRGRATFVRWVILLLLCLISFVAYVLRTNMSIAGEGMMTEAGLSQVQLGLVLAAFAWGNGIFQFPGGVLGQILGARKALTLALIAWAVREPLTKRCSCCTGWP